MVPSILVVDDERTLLTAITDYLTVDGFTVEVAENCAEAEARASGRGFDAVVLDYSLPDGNAITLLPRLLAVDPDLPVLVLTGHGTIDLAVRAIKVGAEQFLTKPIALPSLAAILRRLVESRRLKRRETARRQVRPGAIEPFVGPSAAVAALREQAERVAGADRPTLLVGETGSGKGVLARWLHENGPRAGQPFVEINCAGLSRELLDSDLFGHERGAFTGATAPKAGLFEVADRGTLFLDEIGDMEPATQPKLLKVLEDRRFRRVGATRERQVDVRLISATHREIQPAGGGFREDLYYRLTTLSLRLPPLRERIEDLPALTEDMLARLGAELGRSDLHLSPEALHELAAYPWPGNLRELRNVLERAALLQDQPRIDARHLRLRSESAPAPIATAGAPAAVAAGATVAGDLLADVERAHIERILDEEQGRVDSAARRLGLPRSTLYQRLKLYGRSRG